MNKKLRLAMVGVIAFMAASETSKAETLLGKDYIGGTFGIIQFGDDELDDVLMACTSQHFLEARMSIAFGADREGGAQLHRGPARAQQFAHPLVAVDPAGRHQRQIGI